MFYNKNVKLVKSCRYYKMEYLKFNQEVLTDLFEHLEEGLYILTPERTIIFWNKGAEKITGFSKEEIIGKNCKDNILQHIDKEGNNLCLNNCPVVEVVKTGKPTSARVYLHHKLGYRVPVKCYFTPIKEKGKVVAVIEIFKEIDEECEGLKQRIEMLEKLALIDELTQLFNRRYINWILNTKISEVKRFKRIFGVLFFDIDNFKEINDTYGHLIGDKVLRSIAKTLKSNFRMEDIAGRWGGDEFILIVALERPEDIFVVAKKLKLLIETSFIEIQGTTIYPTISLGGTLISPNDTIETLIDRVDRLMYESKNSGGNIVVEYKTFNY